MIKGISLNNRGTFNAQQRPYYFNEALLAFGFLILCFAFILPDLFFLRLSPMGGSPSAIKDPSVSWAAFMPAFREFRYELFENGNILWSNLRSLGLPVLGNGVQGAPLFPLNLSLVWLPDSLYWSVMPILRVILIALGTYLLGRRVFGLSVVAGVTFALLAGFNVNVLRWINHPWQNGLLAGLWYTYFCCTLFIHAKHTKRSTLFWHWIGLVIAVFGMITNGFPEASALAALMALFIFIGFIGSHWSEYKTNLLKPLTLIFLAHIVGLSLSAVQTFALLEFIDVGAAMELREGFIGGIYKPKETVPFILSQFTYFWATPTLLKYLNFSLGLFGTFFFIRGLFYWLKTAQRPWLGIACLLMMGLYIVKSFGLLSAVESAFASIPVLAQSHFPLYFSPLFYFGAIYFVALGVQSYLQFYKKRQAQKIVSFVISCLACLVVLFLCAWNIAHFVDLPWFGLIEFIFKEQLRHFLIFIIGITFLLGYQFFNLFDKFNNSSVIKRFNTPVILGLIIIVCFVAEIKVTTFDEHTERSHWTLGLTNDLTETFDQAVENSPFPRHELRSNDRNGDYVGYGISTIDNGVSAILPPDQRKVRVGLFQTTFAGYFPVDKSRRNWSWEALSSNLVLVGTTPRVNIDWSQRRYDAGINASTPDARTSIFMPRGEPFYLEGEVDGFFEVISTVTPWIHFAGKEQDFWVEGNIAGNDFLGKTASRQKIVTRWRIRIPNNWLEEDQYEITVRFGQNKTGVYADTKSFKLTLLPIEASAERYNKYSNLVDAPLLSASADENLHIYYNPKSLPRAYIASKCIDNVDDDKNLEFLRASDSVLKGHITFADLDTTENLNCDTYSADFKRVAIEKDSGSSLQLETIKGPAIVTVNNYYYPGWKAKDKLTGEEFEVLRSNSLFRSVYLPEAREYQLTMDYQPWWLKVVYILLILAVTLILLTWRYLGKVERDTIVRPL